MPADARSMKLYYRFVALAFVLVVLCTGCLYVFLVAFDARSADSRTASSAPEVGDGSARDATSRRNAEEEQRLQHGHRQSLIPDVFPTSADDDDSSRCPAGLRQAHVDFTTLGLYETLNMTGSGGGDNDWSDLDVGYNVGRWRNEPLQVFLVPFSHSDPGWHKTATEHFFDDSWHTINNAVLKLHQHENMTFIWAESIYLSWWWETANSTMRDMMKALLAEGRFEIVGGGWVMPDEANPTGYALIDQLLEGHLFLRQNLGIAPESGFAIDPFGHSSTAARILRKAGLKQSVLQRIHYDLKMFFDKTANAEFFWRQAWDVAGDDDLRVYMNPYRLYSFKFTCGPDYRVCLDYDFQDIPGPFRDTLPAMPIQPRYIHAQALRLLDQLRKKSLLFKHNVLLVLLGDDFRYTHGVEFDQQYENWSKLCDFFNQRSHKLFVKAKFGTLSEYFQAADAALTKDASRKSPLMTVGGDFFTYNDEDESYWSGYFTTRMAWKVLGRRLESALRAADIFFALSADARDSTSALRSRKAVDFEALHRAHQQLALFQHHDDITGTSKEHNALDLARRLSDAFSGAQRTLGNALWSILETKTTVPGGDVLDQPLQVTLFADSRDVRVRQVVVDLRSAGRLSSLVVLANALPFKRREIIRLRVNRRDVTVAAQTPGSLDTHTVVHQIDPVWALHRDRIVVGIYELVFQVEIESFEVKKFFVHAAPPTSASGDAASIAASPIASVKLFDFLRHTPTDHKSREFVVTDAKSPARERFILSNGCLAAEFDGATGLLRRLVKARPEGEDVGANLTLLDARLSFRWYPSVDSGAYLFLPSGEAREGPRPIKAMVVVGPLVASVRVVFPLVENYVEMVGGELGVSTPNLPPLTTNACASSSILDSLRISNRVFLRGSSRNLELVMRIDTDIDSGADFFTDANGLSMMRRRRLAKLPIQGNYYPMPTAAFIEDRIGGTERRRLTLLSAQPQGVSSQRSGSLEAMQDRRLLNDDFRGMGEGVVDNVPSTLEYALTLEERSTTSRSPRIPLLSLGAHHIRRRLNSPVEAFFSNDPAVFAATAAVADTNAATAPVASVAAVRPFPCDVDLLSLRPLPNLALESHDAEKLLPNKEAAAVFTLSRPSFDCRYLMTSDVSSMCNATAGSSLFLSRHFGEVVELKKARAASLTLLRDGAALGDDPVVELEPEALISVVAEVRRRQIRP